jgi:hypothetical protein
MDTPLGLLQFYDETMKRKRRGGRREGEQEKR